MLVIGKCCCPIIGELLHPLLVSDLYYDLLRICAISATVTVVRFTNYRVYIDVELLFASTSGKAELRLQSKGNSDVPIHSSVELLFSEFRYYFEWL